jgi:hypothetical protein
MKSMLITVTVLTIIVDVVYGAFIAGMVKAIAASGRCLTPIDQADLALYLCGWLLLPLVIILLIAEHIGRKSVPRSVQVAAFAAWGTGAAMLVVNQFIWNVVICE